MGEYDAIGDLADDGSRQRETYARYGVAMYYAQVFEHGLVNALVLARQVSGGKADPEDWDRAFGRLFKATAADLARRVGNCGGLSGSELAILQAAVAERNRLAHDFFREHAEDSMSAAGMQRMVDEADRARELFITADEVAERIVAEAMERLGLPRDLRQVEYDRMLASIRERDGQ